MWRGGISCVFKKIIILNIYGVILEAMSDNKSIGKTQKPKESVGRSPHA